MVDYGFFDACLRSRYHTNYNNGTKSIPGQFVIGRAKVNNKEIDWGTCLPGSCNWYQSGVILEKLSPRFGLNFTQVAGRQQIGEYKQWNPIQTWVTTFLVLNLVLVILSTVYEVWSDTPKSKLLTSFSLYRNGSSLFTNRNSGRLGLFDGAKVIAILEVVLNHSFGSIIMMNQLYCVDNCVGWFSNKIILLFNEAHVGVDIFLFVSGYLIVTQFFSTRKKG